MDAVNWWTWSVGGCGQLADAVNLWMWSVGGCDQLVDAVNWWMWSVEGRCHLTVVTSQGMQSAVSGHGLLVIAGTVS